MRDADIFGYTRATPFRPFRLVLNSGRTYDVTHPETVAVEPLEADDRARKR